MTNTTLSELVAKAESAGFRAWRNPRDEAMTAPLRAFTNGDPSTWPAVASGLTTRTCRCGTMFHVRAESADRCCDDCMPWAGEVQAAVFKLLRRAGWDDMTARVTRRNRVYTVDVHAWGHASEPWLDTDGDWQTVLREAHDAICDARPVHVRLYWQGRRDAWAKEDGR